MKFLMLFMMLFMMLWASLRAQENQVEQTSIRPHTESEVNNDVASIVLSSNSLAFLIYDQIKPQDNFVFSPYSLMVGLGMVYSGAEGTTQSQMARILRFPLQAQSLGRAFSTLTKQINHLSKAGLDGFFLNVANGLWIQRGQKILPEFQKSVVEDYNGVVKAVDFSVPNDVVRGEINTWIRDKTQGKVNELFERGAIPRDTKLLLASTVYLKAKWQKPFDSLSTLQTPFFSDRESTMTVPMMTQTGRFNYYKGSNFALLQLPYDVRQGPNFDLVMVILLPDDTHGLAQLEKQLDGPVVREWMQAASEKKIVVSLPKFHMISSMTLNETLARIGLVAPFSNTADFSGIDGSEDLKISQIYQKSYITIDEKGTEAAAATGVTITSKALDVDSPEIFLADHPFFYAVIEKTTGVILFMGRVANPSK